MIETPEKWEELFQPRGDARQLEPTRQLLGELWAHRADDRPVEWVELEAAVRLGAASGESGAEPGPLTRTVLDAGRTLVDWALGQALVNHAEAERLSELADEAAVRAITAWERARFDRRESWLSFMTHDLKNPLNTMLNALWLIREH